MTLTLTTLFNLTSSGQLSTGVNSGLSSEAGVTSGGFVDSDGNLLFTGGGGQPATVYEPSAQTVNAGSIVEIVLTPSGYASAATTVAQFNGTNGVFPNGGLVADAAGNLFGVTWMGGSALGGNVEMNGYGTVFEIAKMANGYASTPIIFNLSNGIFPDSLLIDSTGNLFGATFNGGSSNGGTVFEIAKTAGGYASTPTTLVSFSGSPAATSAPSSLIADQNGDLFGIAAGADTVFEIAKTTSGYAATSTTLASFPVAGAANSYFTMGKSLVMDGSGDLFGSVIGANGSATIFEIAKTAHGYASTPVTVATIDNLPVTLPSDLIIDSRGDLFGVLNFGFANKDGTVFEVAKTASGYASTLTTLVDFNGTNGSAPYTLFADNAGNLFGVTYSGGSNGDGTVFEISGAGFTVTAATALNGHLTSSATIADSAANVTTNLDSLETLAASGKVLSISLTDSGIPSISVMAAQLTADHSALADISDNFTLSITAPSTSTSITGFAGHGNLVAFAGNAASYTITPSGNGTSFTVSNSTITDTLTGITALQFSDHTDFIASQTPVAAGGVSSAQVANLYAAVFARTPDVAGLAYYEAAASANPSVPITSYAQNFISSPEYTNNSSHNYAQTAAGDAQFITDTYNNLLSRAPASGDVAWYQTNVLAPYLQGLTPGTTAYTLAELQAHAALLADFSQSQEFLGDVQITTAQPASAQHWLALI